MSSEGFRGRRQRIFRRACGRFATGVRWRPCWTPRDAPRPYRNSFTFGIAGSAADAHLPGACGHDDRSVSRGVALRNQRVIGGAARAFRPIRAQGLRPFRRAAWEAGSSGVPLIPGALAQMECATHQRITSGDHDIFVGRMERANVADGDPLIYYASGYRVLR